MWVGVGARLAADVKRRNRVDVQVDGPVVADHDFLYLVEPGVAEIVRGTVRREAAPVLIEARPCTCCRSGKEGG